jgi:hypothetical protein
MLITPESGTYQPTAASGRSAKSPCPAATAELIIKFGTAGWPDEDRDPESPADASFIHQALRT